MQVAMLFIAIAIRCDSGDYFSSPQKKKEEYIIDYCGIAISDVLIGKTDNQNISLQALASIPDGYSYVSGTFIIVTESGKLTLFTANYFPEKSKMTAQIFQK